MVVHAGALEPLDLLVKDVGGHRDDGNAARGPRQVADHPRRGLAADAGHLDVHQHQVVGRGLHGFHRRFAARHDVEVVAVGLDQRAGEELVELDVLDEEQVADGSRRALIAGGVALPEVGAVQRQGEPEGRPPALPAFHADRAAHDLDEVFADGQAQARAAELPADGRVGLAEALEQAVLLIGGDADPRVRHGEPDVVEIPPLLHADIERDRSGFRELDGVVQEVEQDLLDARLVAKHHRRQRGIHRGGQVEALAGGDAADDGERVGNERAPGEGRVLDLDGAGLDLGEVQHVVDHRQQGRAGGLDEFGLVAEPAGQGFVLQHQVGETDDTAEGRADLVAHDGQEIRLRPVGGFRLALRDLRALQRGGEVVLGELALAEIAQDRDEADGAVLLREGKGFQLDPHPGPVLVQQPTFHVTFGAVRFRPPADRLPDRARLLGVDEIEDVGAGHALGLPPEQPGAGG